MIALYCRNPECKKLIAKMKPTPNELFVFVVNAEKRLSRENVCCVRSFDLAAETLDLFFPQPQKKITFTTDETMVQETGSPAEPPAVFENGTANDSNA